MDQATLVMPAEWYDKIRHRGELLLTDLASNGLEIHAAGWVRTDTDGEPYLYIVSPLVGLGRAGDGYAILQAVVRAGKFQWPPLEVKLISDSHPLAEGLTRMGRAYAERAGEPITFTGDRIGLSPIVGPAFIYPTPKPAPAAGD